MFSALRRYPREWLADDGLASLSLFAVLVPQALAYGHLAGLPAVFGLYTALAAMVAYAIFGTSRWLCVGPESATAAVCATVIAPLAGGDTLRAAMLSSLLALCVGAALFVAFALRLDFLSRLLSAPVLVGYLTGVGITIILGQLFKVTGLHWGSAVDLVRESGLGALFARLGYWRPVLALTSAAAVWLGARWSRRLPMALLVLAVATLAVIALDLEQHGVPVIGPVARGLPHLGLPKVAWRDVTSIAGPALSMALLVYVDSLSTAKGLQGRTGPALDASREILALATANTASALFHGFPASGSGSRSALLQDARARSRMAGLFGAVLVAVALLGLTPAFTRVPIAALAGVIIAIASQLIDVRELLRIWRVRRADLVLALATFLGVISLGVLGGIAVGVLASLAEMMRRVMHPHTAVLGNVPGTDAYRDIDTFAHATTVPGLIVYRFDAPLFFGNADLFHDEILRLIEEADEPVRQVVINAESINDLDLSAIQMLEALDARLESRGIGLAMARTKLEVRQILSRSRAQLEVGGEHVFFRVDDAVDDFLLRESRQPTTLEQRAGEQEPDHKL